MSDRNKKRCIVLLPAGLHFKHLYDEVLEAAIVRADLLPCLFPENLPFPTPINIFIDEIEQAAALFADVSENTPEIWLAVGCATALGKPLCLISSTLDSTLPLGIQYLPLIPYPTDAFPSDYTLLQQNISAELLATMPQTDIVQPEPEVQSPFLPSTPAPKPSDDLVSYEVLALTIIDLKASDSGLSPRALGLEMQVSECGHLTSHAMNALKRRGFVERRQVPVSEGNELHISDNLFITHKGEEWLIRHGKRMPARRSDTRSRELFLNKK
jgi:hypothetical protein